MPLDSTNLTQFSDIFGTADTISESEDAEFLSASEAVKKLEEVTFVHRKCPRLVDSPSRDLFTELAERNASPRVASPAN